MEYWLRRPITTCFAYARMGSQQQQLFRRSEQTNNFRLPTTAEESASGVRLKVQHLVLVRPFQLLGQLQRASPPSALSSSSQVWRGLRDSVGASSSCSWSLKP